MQLVSLLNEQHSLDKKYANEYSTLQEKLKSYDTRFYNNLKTLQLGLGNCKLSLLQSFYGCSDSLFGNPYGVYDNLVFKTNELTRGLEEIENDMKSKLADINEIQKSLLKTMMELDKQKPQPIPPIPEKFLNMQATEQSKSKNEQGVTEESTKPNDDEQKRLEEEKAEKQPQENSLKKESEGEQNLTEVETKNPEIVEQRLISDRPLNPKFLILELEKQEKLDNLDIEVKLYNEKIDNLSQSFRNYITDINQDRKGLVEHFVKSAVNFKNEETKLYESVFNQHKDLLEKEGTEINVPTINIDDTLNQEIPDYLNSDNCIKFLQDIIRDNAASAYLGESSSPTKVSSLKNQASHLKSTVTSVVTTKISSGYGYFKSFFKKPTNQNRDLLRAEEQAHQQIHEQISEQTPILNQTQAIAPVEPVPAKQRLGLYEFLDLVLSEGEIEPENLTMVKSDFQDERNRRDVVSYFKGQGLSKTDKTLKDETYFALLSISSIFLNVCSAERDWLDAVQFIFQIQDFNFVLADKTKTYMIDDLMDQEILENQFFWITLNTHLFRLSRHKMLARKENVDIKKVLVEDSFKKNMILLKRFIDKPTFLEIFEGVVRGLKIMTDANSEVVKSIETCCLVIILILKKIGGL